MRLAENLQVRHSVRNNFDCWGLTAATLKILQDNGTEMRKPANAFLAEWLGRCKMLDRNVSFLRFGSGGR
jgi:hypothetical protein